MKDKLSHSNCYYNEGKNIYAPENPVTSGETAEYTPADRNDRKSKTWCSYMEMGFRESRIMIGNTVETEHSPEIDLNKNVLSD